MYSPSQCLCDDSEEIRDITVFFLTERLLARFPKFFSQHFIESIFHYNCFEVFILLSSWINAFEMDISIIVRFLWWIIEQVILITQANGCQGIRGLLCLMQLQVARNEFWKFPFQPRLIPVVEPFVPTWKCLMTHSCNWQVSFNSVPILAEMKSNILFSLYEVIDADSPMVGSIWIY